MSQGNKFIRLHQSLMALTHHAGFHDEERLNKLQRLTRACAQELGVGRVSVWALNGDADQIDCEVLYIARADEFESGLTLKAEDFPVYFDAVKADRIIDAGDAQSDPRTREFTEPYLKPNNICAMLDAPIFFNGATYGVLCVEAFDAPRTWDVAEMSYVAALADTISLANEHESWMAAHEKMEFLEHNDSLTGLENRRSFLQRIDRDLEELPDTPASRALIIIGLDHFTAINDHLGQHQADKILSQVAFRLHALVQQYGVWLARIGGDEFGLWLQRSPDEEQLASGIKRLQAIFSEPLHAQGGRSVELTASVGVVIYPQPGQDIRDPIRCAEVAMRRAKEQARGSVEHFSPQWMGQLVERRELESDLVEAFASGQLQAFYQPIVAVDPTTPLGLEALVRWKHPTKGVLSPFVFLPLVAEMGLMSRLGDFMLRQACSDICTLREQGHNVGWVSVNLAAEQLYNSALVENVRNLLLEFQLPASCLELEIVEELIGQDSSSLSAQLSALGELGVRLAIDDFGTGYSSLSRLKLLPVNKLKIDKSFVDGLPSDEDDQCIARSIIGLAHGMSLQLVAEGWSAKSNRRGSLGKAASFYRGIYSQSLCR